SPRPCPRPSTRSRVSPIRSAPRRRTPTGATGRRCSSSWTPPAAPSASASARTTSTPWRAGDRMSPAEERKLVTVLFADLAGSTELAIRHDPEQLRALLTAYFEEMAQQVRAFGGVVEKYAGDAIMAVFGVPPEGEPGPPDSLLRGRLRRRPRIARRHRHRRGRRRHRVEPRVHGHR